MTGLPPEPDDLTCRHQSLRRSLARRWHIFGVAWCCLAVLGWSVLLGHTYRPATSSGGVTSWPEGDTYGASPCAAKGAFRIVVFAHPGCPCTRATLHKVDESLTRLPRTACVSVIFVTPGLKRTDICGSDTLAFARRLPGVEVRLDDTGAEARRFGATVSGEVFAFDGRG